MSIETNVYIDSDHQYKSTSGTSDVKATHSII